MSDFSSFRSHGKRTIQRETNGHVKSRKRSLSDTPSSHHEDPMKLEETIRNTLKTIAVAQPRTNSNFAQVEITPSAPPAHPKIAFSLSQKPRVHTGNMFQKKAHAIRESHSSTPATPEDLERERKLRELLMSMKSGASTKEVPGETTESTTDIPVAIQPSTSAPAPALASSSTSTSNYSKLEATPTEVTIDLTSDDISHDPRTPTQIPQSPRNAQSKPPDTSLNTTPLIDSSYMNTETYYETMANTIPTQPVTALAPTVQTPPINAAHNSATTVTPFVHSPTVVSSPVATTFEIPTRETQDTRSSVGQQPSSVGVEHMSAADFLDSIPNPNLEEGEVTPPAHPSVISEPKTITAHDDDPMDTDDAPPIPTQEAQPPTKSDPPVSYSEIKPLLLSLDQPPSGHSSSVSHSSHSSSRSHTRSSHDPSRGHREHERRDKHERKERDRDRHSDRHRDRDRDRHRDRDRDRDRHKDRDRDRDRDRHRHRHRDRDGDRDRDRHRDRDRDRTRHKDRDRGRGRDRDRDRDRDHEHERGGKKRPRSERHHDHSRDQRRSSRERAQEAENQRKLREKEEREEQERIKKEKEEAEKRRKIEEERALQAKRRSKDPESIRREREERKSRWKKLAAFEQREKALRAQAVSAKEVKEECTANDEGAHERIDSVAHPLSMEGVLRPLSSTKNEESDEDVVDQMDHKLTITESLERSKDDAQDGDGIDMFDGNVSDSGVFVDDRPTHFKHIVYRTGVETTDDTDGYYNYQLGEVLNMRFHITGYHGKGVFSNVLKAKDMETEDLVAIKLLRSNAHMTRAGRKEIAILERLCESDPESKYNTIRLHSYFEDRSHLCLVFENMEMNLRQLIKSYGSRGLNVNAVRVYGFRLLKALVHMRREGIIHADLKPDNILVDRTKDLVKVGDLGSAMEPHECTPTPLLVSRFYRAPEIVLGAEYGYPIDVFSYGCVVFEMSTGKPLLRSRDNNHHMEMILQHKGMPSKSYLQNCQFNNEYFDSDGNFLSTRVEAISHKKRKYHKATTSVTMKLTQAYSAEDEIRILQLCQLVEKCLEIEPSDRLTPTRAIKHVLFSG